MMIERVWNNREPRFHDTESANHVRILSEKSWYFGVKSIKNTYPEVWLDQKISKFA